MRWLQWLGRFLPSPTPRPEDHVSIWSVKAEKQDRKFDESPPGD